MKRKPFTLIFFSFFCSIILSIALFTGCDNSSDNNDTPPPTTTDTTAPTITSTTPADGVSISATGLEIVVTFDEEMDPDTITVNTAGNNVCTGTIQISSTLDDFVGDNCEQFTTAVSADTGNKTFRATLDLHTIDYYLKVTTDAEDAAGNALESEYKISFTAN